MFSVPLDRLNIFLNFPLGTIADIITIIVIIIAIFFVLKSGLSAPAILGTFILLMGVLEVLGISSTFNIVTLITDALL